MLDRLIHRWLRVPYTLHVRQLQSPKKPRATVVLIHGIGSSSLMWRRLAETGIIEKDIRVLAVDLLGFGASPRPHWKVYDVATQTKSLAATLLAKKITGPVVLVGHSLGALVAVNYASSLPNILVKSLILCSPPLYNSEEASGLTERQLRAVYRKIIATPELGKAIASDLAQKYRLINPGFQVDESNLPIFLDTLDAAIINQKSLQQIAKLKQPIDIFYGQFDPVVVTKNLKRLARRKSITLTKLLTSSHEIDARYAKIIAGAINQRARHIAPRDT